MGVKAGEPKPQEATFEVWLEGYQDERMLGHNIGPQGMGGGQWEGIFEKMRLRLLLWKKLHATNTTYGKAMALKVHVCSCIPTRHTPIHTKCPARGQS